MQTPDLEDEELDLAILNADLSQGTPITRFFPKASTSLSLTLPRLNESTWSSENCRHYLASEAEFAEFHYPSQLEIRPYQYNITKHALQVNTLVALPTGLGKTLIAAVLIHNYWRWFPRGLIIFLAPTRPLVEQQMQACQKLVGISAEKMLLMTGTTQRPQERLHSWRFSNKRIFFATPQLFNNDLAADVVEKERIVLVVFDEAHRASKDHAYCQIMRELDDFQLRVLALSATPGSSLDHVQDLCNQLHIAHIEVRSEDAAEVRDYVHRKREEIIRVALDQETTLIRDALNRWMQPLLQRLARGGAIRKEDSSDLKNWSMWKVHQTQQKWRSIARLGGARMRMEGDFHFLMHVGKGYQILALYGLPAFYRHMQPWVEGNSTSKMKLDMLQQQLFIERVWNPTKRWLEEGKIGREKIRCLVRLINDHFNVARLEQRLEETRIMVFCELREMVAEIAQALQGEVGSAVQFIGQGNKQQRGMSQKEQLQVMDRFRSGAVNILVATCIGEEGLDVGGVDLIVCFDAKSSAIRMLQRHGRTGRQREGRVCVLVTKDSNEESGYVRAKQNHARIIHLIEQGKVSTWRGNPRMLPVKPVCRMVEFNPILSLPSTSTRKRKLEQPVKLLKQSVKKADIDIWKKSFQSLTGRFIGNRSLKVQELFQTLSFKSARHISPAATNQAGIVLPLEEESSDDLSLPSLSGAPPPPPLAPFPQSTKDVPLPPQPRHEKKQQYNCQEKQQQQVEEEEFQFDSFDENELLDLMIPSPFPIPPVLKSSPPVKAAMEILPLESEPMILLPSSSPPPLKNYKRKKKGDKVISFIDMEAGISSNDEDEEEDEDDGSEKDDQFESSFIVPSSDDAADLGCIYRQSLLTQAAGGLGFGPKNGFSHRKRCFALKSDE